MLNKKPEAKLLPKGKILGRSDATAGAGKAAQMCFTTSKRNRKHFSKASETTESEWGGNKNNAKKILIPVNEYYQMRLSKISPKVE